MTRNHTINSESNGMFDQWEYSAHMCESPPDNDELLRRVLTDEGRTNIGPSPEAVINMIGMNADYPDVASAPVTTRAGAKANKKQLECKLFVLNHNNLGKNPRKTRLDKLAVDAAVV